MASNPNRAAPGPTLGPTSRFPLKACHNSVNKEASTTVACVYLDKSGDFTDATPRGDATENGTPPSLDEDGVADADAS